jgi:phospholipid/cholesterol/gamma-HCH transport system permease protein
MVAEHQPGRFTWQPTEAGGLAVALAGAWTLTAAPPSGVARLAGDKAATAHGAAWTVDLTAVTSWDSRLLGELFALAALAECQSADITWHGLTADQQRLLEQARHATFRRAAPAARRGPWQLVCAAARRTGDGCLAVIEFTGEWILALGRLLRGRSALRGREFLAVLGETGAAALPIVTLISFLVGLIIAFLGAVVLRNFGAEFAVSYLVGYGMLREMGAIMTGVIMAGRTGAAFAARIGSMKINEELDALRTFGIAPMDTVVLPRILALVLMLPLLTIYANVVGIFGGYLVAEYLMNVPASIFFREMRVVIGPGDFILGVAKALVFGMLIATAGCLRGLQCGTGAGAVGVAATRAVVTGITLIIIANAIIDWLAATYRF